MRHRFAILATLALAYAGCTSVAGSPTQSACRTGDAMIETQLFLGLSKSGGGQVSAVQFDRFVKDEVVPRFPEGFSVLDGKGFWLDGQTKRTISERSKVIVRLHPPDAAADVAIDAIAGAYKTRFAQEAVLRVDKAVCARF